MPNNETIERLAIQLNMFSAGFLTKGDARAALSEMRTIALREAAEIAKEWATHYPVDVFPPPSSDNRDMAIAAGIVPDMYSAAAARHSSMRIAAAILGRIDK